MRNSILCVILCSAPWLATAAEPAPVPAAVEDSDSAPAPQPARPRRALVGITYANWEYRIKDSALLSGLFGSEPRRAEGRVQLIGPTFGFMTTKPESIGGGVEVSVLRAFEQRSDRADVATPKLPTFAKLDARMNYSITKEIVPFVGLNLMAKIAGDDVDDHFGVGTHYGVSVQHQRFVLSVFGETNGDIASWMVAASSSVFGYGATLAYRY